MTNIDEITALMRAFQEGYIRRDLSQVDAFMEFFIEDAEVIGTNGIRPSEGEWYMNRASARELVAGDWEGWGDLLLDLEKMSVHADENAGWVSASATVTQTIGEDNYQSYLNFVKTFMDDPNLSAEYKLLHILRGGTNTLYEIRRGEKFVWPLRFTAVLLHRQNGWKFAQIHFSFPTVYFPDVRLGV